jgi:hypothetical protein
VPGVDSKTGRGRAGLTAAEVALIEGRPAGCIAGCIAAAGPQAGRTEDTSTLSRGRALVLIARAHLDLGELEAAAETAAQGLAFAESMNLGSVTSRLRIVRSVAIGEPTDEAAAEFRALAGRITEPDLRWWFDRQPLAPLESRASLGGPLTSSWPRQNVAKGRQRAGRPVDSTPSDRHGEEPADKDRHDRTDGWVAMGQQFAVCSTPNPTRYAVSPSLFHTF